MSFYARVAWFHFQIYLAYPVELLAIIIRPVIDIGMLLLFWNIVIQSSSQQVSLVSLLSYFLIAIGISDLLFMDGLRLGSAISKKVRRGLLSQTLIKPVQPLFFELACLIGYRGIRLVTALVFIILGLIMQPPPHWFNWILFVASMALALVVSMSFNIMIGSLSFYITEIAGVRNMITHVSRLLSGALIPLFLFPETLKHVALALPFATVVYGPTQALKVDQLSSQVWLILVIGLIWCVILLPLSLWAWKKGLRQYDGVGI